MPVSRIRREEQEKQARSKITAIGSIYGLWTVIDGPCGNCKWMCRCKCGTEKLVDGRTLRAGTSKACHPCGNKLKSETGKRFSQLSRKLYRRLMDTVKTAFYRCNNPQYQSYPDYGGRGIKVMFKDKMSFVEHLTTLDGYDNPLLELDRINNDGHYELGNLRYTTYTESNNNRRPSKTKCNTELITHNGKTQRLFDWAKELGTNLPTLMNRISRGWSIEKTISTPVRRIRR